MALARRCCNVPECYQESEVEVRVGLFRRQADNYLSGQLMDWFSKLQDLLSTHYGYITPSEARELSLGVVL